MLHKIIDDIFRRIVEANFICKDTRPILAVSVTSFIVRS